MDQLPEEVAASLSLLVRVLWSGSVLADCRFYQGGIGMRLFVEVDLIP